MKDKLIYGNIYTMDEAGPRVAAMGVSGGKVVFTGTREEAAGFDGAEVLDFGDKTILPGFIDTHVHVIPSGIFMKPSMEGSAA